MIFVKLILGGFGILMSNMSQVQNIPLFQGCDKIVLQLHTAVPEKPDTPKHIRVPNKSFPKISGFVHFCKKLVPSEKYYNLQSLLITLYFWYPHSSRPEIFSSVIVCLPCYHICLSFASASVESLARS